MPVLHYGIRAACDHPGSETISNATIKCNYLFFQNIEAI